MRLVRHPRRVISRFALRDRNAGGIIPVLDVIELYAVESLLDADLHARDHDRRQNSQLADIQPALMRPSYIAFPEYGRRKFRGVRACILPRADIHVAIRMLSPLVNRGYGGDR